jgi:glycosyltransferase involved in cell wall biosynthesis
MYKEHKISLVIPAYNEEQLIEQCLQSVFNSLIANKSPSFTSEVIVVDNNSTDNSAALARKAGAKVVFEPINQIGRARNTGAAAATGDWLLFVDADSLLNTAMVADILQMIKAGRNVGCGSTMRMPGAPGWGNAILNTWTGVSRLFRWASGALVVCRADAFRDVGGFSQELYVADEIKLSQLLKKWGKKRGLKFSILTKHPLETSPRKLQLYSRREIIGQFFSGVIQPNPGMA